MASRTITEKATRLLAEGRIELDVAPVRSYTAIGDTGTYKVFVGATVRHCTCPATGSCKHLDAVIAREHAAPDLLAVMDEAVAVRKARDAEHADDLFARLGA